ncbi:ATP-grasp domain-containing protein [Schlesneria paludicola]|uniref:ATP-grasp domain-containing protein n=1 Tax=Schlesneria paludicola TaxID=360056 RepID=UPI0002E22C95|nr:ATP-grasp domain-containing protein [Schlesneria paludicola]
MSEYLVGGGADVGSASESMQREGLAMLTALVSDFAQMPGFQVVTTLQQGVRANLDGQVIHVQGPADESNVFEELLSVVDAVLVIAPETDGILASRCRRVVEAGVSSWNCSPAAIGLCGDKLRLAVHLQSRGLPTIPTALADWDRGFPKDSPPLVLKPRDGAGSNLTFLVKSTQDWHSAAERYRQANLADRALRQPFVSGSALSTVAILGLDGQWRTCLPIGTQRLSNDGRFRYLGGAIPAMISAEQTTRIESLVRATCQTIPGLVGYVGIDFLLTEQGDVSIVEINPRLTTSYVGYRQLISNRLPELWLSTDPQVAFVHSCGPIEFGIG